MKKPNKVVIHPVVDIVIPVYGRFDLLSQCLAAIPEAVSDNTYKVYLVDNNSQEVAENVNEVVEFYRNASNLPNVHVIRNRENVGFPKACNQGVKAGSGVYVFLLNSDCIIEPQSLAKMLSRIKDNTMLGVVGMKLIFPDVEQDSYHPSGKLQHIGLATNPRGEVIHPMVGWNPDNWRVNRIREVYGVTGAALLTPRVLWNTVGGLYEGYGLGTYEDIDYCLTVRQFGYNIEVVPDAVGVHYTNASALAYGKAFPINTNRNIFMSRHGGKLQYTDWMMW